MSFRNCICFIQTFLILLLSGCRSSDTTKITPFENSIEETPQIIFLNYSATKKGNSGEYEIKLISKYVSRGTIKKKITQPDKQREGDLECITLDSKLRPIESVFIPDPLNVSVESVDDNNMLFRKELTLDSAEFFVRIPLEKKVASIAIRRKGVSGNLHITKIR